MEHIDQLPMKYTRMIEEGHEAKDRVVCDYIAGMSDTYALKIFNKLFVPMFWYD
jgi:dGTPase